jgi:hypothetical protein
VSLREQDRVRSVLDFFHVNAILCLLSLGEVLITDGEPNQSFMKLSGPFMWLEGAFLAICSASFVGTASAQPPVVIADWTFESSLPAGTPGAGIWITNISAEIGSGTASGWHAGNAVYSSPAGNISAHSFSSTLWAVGDLYQFVVSTAGKSGVTVSWDQTSSSTGPGRFNLAYSTDGTAFTTVLTDYTVLQNGGAPNPAWSPTAGGSVYSFSVDLSGNTALNNQPTLYFRLVDDSTTSAGGGTVGTAGTDRVDNFSVVVPEPNGLLVFGGLGLLVWNRIRRRK